MTADAVGGVWSYAMSLCAGLGSKQIEVLLAVTGPKATDCQRREARAIRGLQLVEGDFDLEWMPNASDRSPSKTWLRSLSRVFNPDIVHINGYADACQDWGCPVVVVAHSCVYSWWSAVHRELPPESWRQYYEHVRSGLCSANAVVAPTAWMLDELKRLYDVDLPLPMAIHNFSKEPKRTHSKQAVVCGGGRVWDPAKNFRVLDDAAPFMAWPVCLFGPTQGPGGASYLPHNVTLFGPQTKEAVLELTAKAQIFAHPSKYEPFGLCVLEAGTNECALVLADIPSLRELWNGAAVFVPPDDSSAWASAINRAAKEIDATQHWGKRAAERAANYSTGRSVERYMDLYLDLISAEGSSRKQEAAKA